VRKAGWTIAKPRTSEARLPLQWLISLDPVRWQDERYVIDRGPSCRPCVKFPTERHAAAAIVSYDLGPDAEVRAR
jgi:hypothetical protein